MRIGITCYPTYGGSGVVATELGIELAALGHEVHFISYSQPFRLNGRDDGIFYHEVPVSNYPLFEFPPYDLALASRMAEVAEYYSLDLLHVHYAIPHSVSRAARAADACRHAAAACPSSPRFTAPTSRSSASTAAICPSPATPSRKATASPASRTTCAKKPSQDFDVTRPIETITNFVNCDVYTPINDEDRKRAKRASASPRPTNPS